MSIAEFVLGFVGIIIGLGVADLLTSLHKLLRAGKRVRWHWATPSLAILMLLVTLVLWWWSFRWFGEIASETIADFLPKFLVLVFGFLMMASALPDEVPDGGIDLREFYLSSRIHLWSLMSATLGAIVVIYWLDHWTIGVTRLVAITWPSIVSFALALVATLTPKMRIHALAIGWIFAVATYTNLFTPIGE